MEAVAGSPVQARSPASGGEDASRQTSIASAPALVVAVRVLCVVSATVKDEPTPRSRASKPASPAPASSVPFLEVANETTIQVRTSYAEVSRCVFNRVYNARPANEDLVQEVLPGLNDSLARGINAGVVTFGQCQTGKSAIMLGVGEEDGVIVRVLESLLGSRSDGKATYTLKVLQVVGESVVDLLADPASTSGLRGDQLGTAVIEHTPITELQVLPTDEDVADVLGLVKALLLQVRDKRVKDSAASSEGRPHLIVMLGHVKEGQPGQSSTIYLADLAGTAQTECYTTPSKHAGVAATNRTLLFLENMLRRRLDDYVPWNTCALTRTLKDLGRPDARTTVLLTLSPSNASKTVTMHSIQFAQLARKIPYALRSKGVVLDDDPLAASGSVMGTSQDPLAALRKAHADSLTAFEAERKEFASQIATLKNLLRDKETLIAQLRASSSTKSEEVNDLKAQITNLKLSAVANQGTASKEMKGLQEKFAASQAELEMLKKEVSALQSRLSDRQVLLEKFTKDIQEVNDKNASLRIQVDQKQDEIDALKAAVGSSSGTAEATIATLKAELAKASAECTGKLAGLEAQLTAKSREAVLAREAEAASNQKLIELEKAVGELVVRQARLPGFAKLTSVTQLEALAIMVAALDRTPAPTSLSTSSDSVGVTAEAPAVPQPEVSRRNAAALAPVLLGTISLADGSGDSLTSVFLAVVNRAVSRVLLQNQSFLAQIKEFYDPTATTKMPFEMVVKFAMDFRLCPDLCAISEIRKIFDAVNTGEDADDDTGTLDQLEFNEFVVRLAILHCPDPSITFPPETDFEKSPEFGIAVRKMFNYLHANSPSHFASAIIAKSYLADA